MNEIIGFAILFVFPGLIVLWFVSGYLYWQRYHRKYGRFPERGDVSKLVWILGLWGFASKLGVEVDTSTLDEFPSSTQEITSYEHTRTRPEARQPGGGDAESQVVIKPPWSRVVIGYLILLMGGVFTSLFVVAMVVALVRSPIVDFSKALPWLILIIVLGLPLIWFGTLFSFRTTKVFFNHELGHIIVTRGHISPLFPFLRTKRISREEARTAHFLAKEVRRGQGGSTVKYEVTVLMKSGIRLALHLANWKGDEAKELTRRILDFGPE